MDEDKIELTDQEGAIVLRADMSPEIYTPVGVGDTCDNIRFTLAFILYAVEKEDWVVEFGNFVDRTQEEFHKKAAEVRRSKFQVIKGEKN